MEKKELRKITRAELNVILDNHNLWLDTAENEGERADLSYTDLRYVDLSCANLSCANLEGANLADADLRYADLFCTDLGGANLSGACLVFARSICTNLHDANLAGADLGWTRLFHADLTGANLSAADLKYANLRHANLEGVNLLGADLKGVNLQNTDLTNVKNFPNIPMECPTEGPFIGWKYAYAGYIIKLEIPEDAKRSSGTSNKCRCNKAKVLAIENRDGTPADVTEVRSNYDPNFIYRVGETVTVDNFDNNRFNVCAPGIHFYMDRESAVHY